MLLDIGDGEKRNMSDRIANRNLVCRKFGKISVLEKIPKQKNKATYYKCKCDCGKEKNIRGTNLTSGRTVSCGCVNKKKNQDCLGKNSRQKSIEAGKWSKYYANRGITFKEFCESHGLTTKIVRARLKKGWSIDRSISTPADDYTRNRLATGKAKGKKLEDWVVKQILKIFDDLTEDDVRRVASSRSGVDILLSEKARNLLPVSFECKNTVEKPGKRAFKQAAKNKYPGTMEAIVWHPPNERYEDTLIMIPGEVFLNFIKENMDSVPSIMIRCLDKNPSGREVIDNLKNMKEKINAK